MSDSPTIQPEISQPISENLQKLASLFPAAVKDGELDVEALREELGDFAEADASIAHATTLIRDMEARALEPFGHEARARLALARGDERDLFEAQDYLRRVKAIFDAMEDPEIERVDASGSADTVFEAIWRIVKKRLREASEE